MFCWIPKLFFQKSTFSWLCFTVLQKLKTSFSSSKCSGRKMAHHSILSFTLLTPVDWFMNTQTIVLTVDQVKIIHWSQLRLVRNFGATVFCMGNFNCFWLEVKAATIFGKFGFSGNLLFFIQICKRRNLQIRNDKLGLGCILKCY